MPWWEIIGWTGSALVVISLIVPSVRRFRRMNLAGSLIATVYNIVFGIWPYAAMNAIITVIDSYWLYKLRTEDSRHYRVTPVDSASALVADFVTRHEQSISQAYPGFESGQLEGARAFITLHEDEIIGLFAYSVDGGEGLIRLDFVTDRFRDLKPGKTLYADSTIVTEGVERLVIAADATSDPSYFVSQGFSLINERLVRDTREIEA